MSRNYWLTSTSALVALSGIVPWERLFRPPPPPSVLPPGCLEKRNGGDDTKAKAESISDKNTQNTEVYFPMRFSAEMDIPFVHSTSLPFSSISREFLEIDRERGEGLTPLQALVTDSEAC